jgi:glycosyltransferase involved in cell wall biosynthesis
MKNNSQLLITAVIPSYKVRKFLKNVVLDVVDYVDYIIVVDDKCPEKSYEVVQGYPKVKIIHHQENQGVGGAVISGYKESIKLNSDIVIKIDGDGQMEAQYIPKLLKPLIEKKAHYTKGNRFRDFKALKSMPKIRLFGNSVLSFMIKMASGYWSMMDPTNGFTAITKETILDLDLDKISKRYFFESDMLIHLNIENKVVKDISIPAKYADEESSLDIKKVIKNFPPKIIKGLSKRIFLKYFIYNFNMASIYLLLGLPMVVFGVVFGVVEWINSIQNEINTPTGTIMLAVLPIILGVEFLLQAINIDINLEPKKVEDDI